MFRRERRSAILEAPPGSRRQDLRDPVRADHDAHLHRLGAVGWELRRRLHDRRVTLELGGNAAVIVEPDGGAFFARTFENGEFVGERDYGKLDYKTAKGEARNASLMFLTGLKIDEPEVAEPTDAEKKGEKAETRRAQEEQAATARTAR